MLSIINTSLAALGLAAVASAASLQQVSNFGSNPAGIQMFQYVPDKLAAKPAIIVALHPCGGNAQGYFGQTKLPSYADQLGFILIYGQTTKQSNCWDVHSSQSLTRNGGGDTQSIVNMVSYTLSKYSGDATKVFAVGSSSGAMMVPNLAATYPDVFAGIAGFSGVPAACMKGQSSSTPSTSDQSCAQGQKTFSPQQWGDLAKAEYSGYSGKRPKVAAYGGTSDFLVTIKTLYQQLDQWSNVFGIQSTQNITNTPQQGYTKMVYGDGTQLVGYVAQGVGHFVPFQEVETLKFFGLTT